MSSKRAGRTNKPPCQKAKSTPPTALQVLESLGIDEPWKVALMIPESYDDVINTIRDARDLDDQARPFTFTVSGPVSTSASRGVPRSTFPVTDGAGAAWRVTVFGPPGAWVERAIAGQPMTWLATAKPYAGSLSITLKEPIEPEYTGQIRPTYPHRRSRRPKEYVRKTVRSYLPQAMGPACAFVASQLQAVAPIERLLADLGCRGWTLQELLHQVHAPRDLRYALHARQAYLSLAALGALARMEAGRAETGAVRPLRATTLERRIRATGYTLTEDQQNAVREVTVRLGHALPMRHLIAGEVGSGKTLVASLVVACAVDASPDSRVLVMAPNATLATQFRREFTQACPDVPSVLVTGDSETDPADTASSRVVFGTSAVLHRDLGQFNLVVVDEQQNWSREQREHYVRPDTHLLELSATCIPRTQALIRYGHITISRMRQCHAAKTIHTRLWQGAQQVQKLMEGIRGVIGAGRPVVVVYPKREKGKTKTSGSGAAGMDPRFSVELARQRWEKNFPGKVRAITSDDDSLAKRQAIADIEEGRASILLATTVVQVGLNIKGLRNMVIASPERHGLTALHQLRGRLARQGGEGFCELLVTGPLSQKAKDRIGALMSTNDGFKLAEMDLELRGSGDLGSDSSTQSGADQTFLYGVPLTIELVEGVYDLWEQYRPAVSGPDERARSEAVF